MGLLATLWDKEGFATINDLFHGQPTTVTWNIACFNIVRNTLQVPTLHTINDEFAANPQ